MGLRKSLEIVGSLLEPNERQSVLGDIHERGPNARALLDLSGLVLLRQLQSWTTWQPWALIASLALPALFAGSTAHPIAYIARSGYLVSYESAWGSFLIQPWVTLGAPAAAWGIGFALSRIGKRGGALALPLLICLSIWMSYQVALSSLRLQLPPSWSTRFQIDFTFSQHIATAVQSLNETTRFATATLAMALLTAVPCIFGFVRGLRNRPVHPLLAIALLAMCLTNIGLFVQLAGPVAITRKIIALWPLIYVLATSRMPREASHVH